LFFLLFACGRGNNVNKAEILWIGSMRRKAGSMEHVSIDTALTRMLQKDPNLEGKWRWASFYRFISRDYKWPKISKEDPEIYFLSSKQHKIDRHTRHSDQAKGDRSIDRSIHQSIHQPIH
jgi:hypothetical protein